ncbi:hypothetical protein K3495_g1731 [Podosphaera aphanis]|nr:hypothetical protein K3495_g1731 [Podosphaera aphanis]
MPQAYYYHIKFELYPFSSSVSLSQGKERSESGVQIPSPDTDIFRVTDWSNCRPVPIYREDKKSKEEKSRETPRLNLHQNLSPEGDLEVESKNLKDKQGYGIGHNSRLTSTIYCEIEGIREKFDSVERSKVETIQIKNLFAQNQTPFWESLKNAEKDWRFGKVSIQGFQAKTMEERFSNEGAGSRSKGLEQRNSESLRDIIASDFKPQGDQKGRVTKAQFVPIIGNDSEVGWGLVHLFRDGVETLSLEPSQDLGRVGEDCTTICIPAVPSYLSPSDFLEWIGEKTREKISHFRMIMTGKLMRYLVLMKFRDGVAAKAWKKEWDGRAFNCMEPEICNVVFIKSITFCPPPSASIESSTSFPALNHDPFTPTTKATSTSSLIELPTCPVCLERMDETTGLLTILCQHVFHCNCLLKWKDSTCPVCRHTTHPSVEVRQEVPFGSGEASICSKCDCVDDLWICLICGNVGCGRYKGGHAKEHWKESAHCFALEIQTQHVWDYAGDVWVHRLIRDKGESSKVIELPGQTRASQSLDTTESYSNQTVPRSKIEVLGVEYTQLVTSQLESQRLYFEDLMQKAAARAAANSAAAASATQSISVALDKLNSLELDHAALKSDLAIQSQELERERSKAAKSNEIARALSKDLAEERRVSEGLMQRIEYLNSSMADMAKEQETLKAENRELCDTNRDLLFCLSAGEKVREMEASGEAGLVNGELEAGLICLPSPPMGKDQGGGSGKRKGKGKMKGKTHQK